MSLDMGADGCMRAGRVSAFDDGPDERHHLLLVVISDIERSKGHSDAELLH